jgi:hypothetical protein
VYSTLIYSLPPGELTKPCVSCSVKNITPRIFDTIIKVCSGLEPEQAPPPSPQQLRVAARQGPMRWAHPPPQGAGSWAILITLYRVRYTVVCDGNSQGALRTASTARHSMQNPWHAAHTASGNGQHSTPFQQLLRSAGRLCNHSAQVLQVYCAEQQLPGSQAKDCMRMAGGVRTLFQ